MSNIAQAVKQEKTMTILSKGVISAGLTSVLTGTGPYTLFAPSDIAFKKLDETVLEKLLKPENKHKLGDILKHHVVSGKINLKELKDGDKLRNVVGKELHVEIKDGKTIIDGSEMGDNTLKATNGVVYELNDVIVKN